MASSDVSNGERSPHNGPLTPQQGTTSNENTKGIKSCVVECGCCGGVWLLWWSVVVVVECGCCGGVRLLWLSVVVVVECGCCGGVWLLW